MQDWAAKGSQLTQPRPCPPRQDAALHTDASHKATVCTKTDSRRVQHTPLAVLTRMLS